MALCNIALESYTGELQIPIYHGTANQYTGSKTSVAVCCNLHYKQQKYISCVSTLVRLCSVSYTLLAIHYLVPRLKKVEMMPCLILLFYVASTTLNPQ